MIFTVYVIHREADGERLLVGRLGDFGRVEFIVVPSRLGTGDELDSC